MYFCHYQVHSYVDAAAVFVISAFRTTIIRITCCSNIISQLPLVVLPLPLLLLLLVVVIPSGVVSVVAGSSRCSPHAASSRRPASPAVGPYLVTMAATAALAAEQDLYSPGE